MRRHIGERVRRHMEKDDFDLDALHTWVAVSSATQHESPPPAAGAERWSVLGERDDLKVVDVVRTRTA